jgi:surface antigen
MSPSDGDLAYARAAASEVLRRNQKDASLPWENPRSGARGTVTPIASAYTQDGQTCRNFLASYINGSDEAWLTGEACRQGKGSWEVRSLKPWKRS